MDRLLDDQPGAGGADLAGVQEDRGQREVERGLAVGVGEDDVGVLAAELEGDLLHRAGGGGHDPLAGVQAAGEGDEVDAGVLAERGAGVRARRRATRLPTPAGRPASSSRRIRWIAVCGVSSLGLSTNVLPAARHGRDLPGRLQQRVVPRRDQAADADRLVHDPADHVGAAGVDDAAARPAAATGRSGGRPPTTSSTSYSLSTSRLPVSSDSARATTRLVALEQVGDAVQQRRPARSRSRPASSPSSNAARAAAIAASVSCGAGLVDLGDQRAVRRAADLPAPALASALPSPPDVELRHVLVSDQSGLVAHVATRCALRNRIAARRQLSSSDLGRFR